MLILGSVSSPVNAKGRGPKVPAELIQTAISTAAGYLQVDRVLIVVEDVRIEGAWAVGTIIVLGPKDEYSEQAPEMTLAFVSQYIEPRWVVFLDLQPEYKPMFDQIPDSLRAIEEYAVDISSTYKILEVPYIDQVYQQKKIQDLDSRWYSRIWYLSGPTSINMILSYLGYTKTYISMTKSIAKITLADPYTEDGKRTNWNNIVLNLDSQCKIKSTLRPDAVSALTYEEIKTRIDGDIPIMLGIRFGKVQHIVVIVGYIEPDIVVVNDPFGGKISPTRLWWTTTNLPIGSAQKTNGYRVEYKFDDLKKLFSGRWLDITSIPSSASSFILASRQNSIQVP
jgi:hypothetical protein